CMVQLTTYLLLQTPGALPSTDRVQDPSPIHIEAPPADRPSLHAVPGCNKPIAPQTSTGEKPKTKSQRPKTQGLFISKRHQRIDLRCTSCRDVTSQHRHHKQDPSNQSKCSSVCRFHFKQQIAQHTHQAERCHNANRHPNACHDKSFLQHHLENVRRTSTESHADTDVMGLLRDRV